MVPRYAAGMADVVMMVSHPVGVNPPIRSVASAVASAWIDVTLKFLVCGLLTDNSRGRFVRSRKKVLLRRCYSRRR